jgi:hypothetical protein
VRDAQRVEVAGADGDAAFDQQPIQAHFAGIDALRRGRPDHLHVADDVRASIFGNDAANQTSAVGFLGPVRGDSRLACGTTIRSPVA